MPLNPNDTLLNGQYRILRLLGRGGFGFVYQAQDTLLRDEVAIKELIPALVGDEAMLKRFLAEARATMRLRHERIVGTHNVFQEGGNYYIVMECMSGGSLEERLREKGSLPVHEAGRITAEVCAGLDYAHKHGIVHCDLKPANILFTSAGGAKVADFGIAHVSGEMLSRSWMTPAGFVAGTLPYMSPEQADGVREDPRVDVYAMGAVLYRMLTGKTYLEFDQRETPRAQAENVNRICEVRPEPPSTHNRRIPAWLDEVVLNALSKRPEERYGSAGEMQAALERRGAELPVPPQAQAKAPLAPPRPSPARWPAWFGPAVAAVGVLVIAITMALAMLFGGGSAPSETPTPEPTQVTVMEPAATLTPTETNILTSTPTDTPSPTLTQIPRPTATLTSRPTATSTSRPTPTTTRKPTSTPSVSTSSISSDKWFWKGNGPFSAENGVLGIVNYTDKVLTVRVERVGVFEVPADTGSVLALETVPGVYMVYARVPDAAEASMAPTWCRSIDSLRVVATRALVLPIKQHPPVWGSRVALAACPFYEDPDKP